MTIGAALLPLLSGALVLFALYQTHVVTALLILHLASWSYLLGIVGLILLPVSEFVRWWPMRLEDAATRQYSSAELRRRPLHMPKLYVGRCTQPSVEALIAGRASTSGEKANEKSVLNRVA